MDVYEYIEEGYDVLTLLEHDGIVESIENVNEFIYYIIEETIDPFEIFKRIHDRGLIYVDEDLLSLLFCHGCYRILRFLKKRYNINKHSIIRNLISVDDYESFVIFYVDIQNYLGEFMKSNCCLINKFILENGYRFNCTPEVMYNILENYDICLSMFKKFVKNSEKIPDIKYLDHFKIDIIRFYYPDYKKSGIDDIIHHLYVKTAPYIVSNILSFL